MSMSGLTIATAQDLDLAMIWIAWGATALLMGGLWVRQLSTRNATSVDLAWAASLGAMAVGYALMGPGSVLQRVISGAAGGLWGGRLALHLAFDRLGERQEDGRYRRMREHWGDRAPIHFAWFYQAQAIAALLLSLPFFLASHNPATSLHAVQWAGLALCLLGVVGEGTADRQLAAFRRDPAHRGRTCRQGLWRYSRHPNYFFEWLIWCGFALVALPAPHGGWAVLAPVVMYVLVRWVTGIPHTEAQALRSRGDDYRRYQASTNAFFPWRPRREGGDPQGVNS